jgi:malate dehydrogenase (oxaloacetate-decarboxylating)(NADP+)
MRNVLGQARQKPKRVVFPEGEHPKVLRAARILVEEKIARPILLGSIDRIAAVIDELDLDLALTDLTVLDPAAHGSDRYWRELYALRQRKGMTEADARKQSRRPMIHAALMVRLGDADALVAGVSQHYPETIRPALQIIQMRRDVSRVAGMYLMVLKDRVLCFADPTVNIDPTAEALADIAILAAEEVRKFQIEPRIAMLSFSNFGSAAHPFVDKVRRATELVRLRAPHLMVDGEMQADTAVTPGLLQEHYPFSTLAGGANVLIFPDLQSANAAYKLVECLAGAEALGPILMGMNRPVHVLQVGCDVQDIVNVAALAVVDAQGSEASTAPARREREPQPV